MRFIALALLCLLPQDAKDDRPNIVFILTDDHRPDGMGCYGNEVVRTPNFDKLAAEGARLDAFVVAAPLCCPSRAAYLTGLYPRQNGVLLNDGRDPTSKGGTIAEVLDKNGYVTGFVGKAHLGGDPRKWGFKEAPVWLPGAASRHENPRLMVDGVAKQMDGHITQIFADHAIAWLDKHKKERFFLWLATTAPHTPYREDPKHAYGKADIKPPPLWPKGEPLGNADWCGYYSTISMLDEQIGRVIAKLKDDGLLDNTFIFVSGDNGFMHGSHGHPAKSVWFEESVRVPALARWPARVKAGAKVATPVVSVDLYPTLCELARVAVPAGLEGASMMKALSGEAGARTVAYSEVTPRRDLGPWQMVRTDRAKYVKMHNGKEHLYDLAADPNELKDLAGEGGRTLEAMRELHRKWLEETK